MNMIRILHVLGGLERGGAETMVMNLYRNINRSQIQFDFIVHTADRQDYYDEVLGLGGKIYSFPKFRLYNIFKVIEYWKRFFNDHPEYKILHSHIRSYASIYLPIARNFGVKTIIHSHSTSNGNGPVSLCKNALQYPLRHCSDYYFACSEIAGKWLFGNKIIKTDKFHVLNNAIDALSYKYDPVKRLEIRRKLNISEMNVVYINVGRLEQPKNHIFLLNIFNEIHKKNCNTKLLLVGGGSKKQEILAQINYLGLSGCIILMGSRNDISELLQAADCFLFPSLWEGLGLGAIEAQASGLPCLCSTGVPKAVRITNLCKFIPIADKKHWINEAENFSEVREDTSEAIKIAGYDITTTTKWLSMFYQKIWNSTQM